MANEHEEIIRIVAVNSAKAAYQSVIADQKLLSQTVVQGNQQQGGAVRNFVGELTKARAEVQSLSVAQRAQIDAGLKVGASYRDIAQSVGVSNLALREYRTEAAGAAKGTDLVATGLGVMRSILPGLTLVGVVAGLKSMATEALDAAGNLIDLSNKTGLSTDALQEMEHVAHQTGTELETFTGATFRLGTNVAEGTKKVREAVKDLGLSYEDLRQKKPEDQFRAVISALEDVDSIQERNRLGVALFGKQFADIAAAVAEGYSEMASAASKSSREQLDALDAAGDAWTKFVDDSGKQMQGLLGTAVLTAQGIKRSFSDMGTIDMLAIVGGAMVVGKSPEQILLAVAAAGQEVKKRTDDIQLSTDGAGKATADYVAQLAALQKELAELTPAQRAQLDAALKLEGVSDKLADQFGLTEAALRIYQTQVKTAAKSLEDADNATAKWNDEQAKFRKEMKESTDALLDFINKGVRKSLTLADDQVKTAERLTKPMADALIKNATLHRAHENELDKLVREKTLSRVEFQLSEIARWAANEKAQLDRNATNWRDHVAIIDQIAKERSQAIVDADEAAQRILFANLDTNAKQRMVELREASRDAAFNGIGALADSFSDLAEISGRGLDGMLGRIAEMIGLLNVAVQAGSGLAQVFGSFDANGKRTGFGFGGFKNAEGKFDFGSITSGGMQAASTGIAAWSSLQQATDVMGRGNRAARGALTGAAIGTKILPGWGTAIGAGVGALVGALRNPAFEDVFNRVGRNYGIKISEGLARAIADEAKTLFKKDRQAAEIFNLDKIIAEGGGVKPETLGKLTARLRDVFVMLGQGKFDQDQAREVLDENFQALVDVAKEKHGLISAELREIMALDDANGTKSQAIAEHVKQSLTAGLGHLTTFLELSAAAAKDNAGEIGKVIAELEKEREELTAGLRPDDDPKQFERDKARISEIQKQIAELMKQAEQAKQLQQGLSITNATSGAAFASAIAGSFQKLLATGIDPMEAIGQVEPAVLALQDQLDKIGIDGGAAFQSLREQIAMTRDEVAGPMTQGMRSIGSSIMELYNAGVLTDDMFAGMTAQIGQTFQALVAQGHNGRTALSLMKPQLQAIWELQQRFGTELDEATQKMLDEAEAAGIVGEKHKSASERMVDGVGKVVDRLDLLLKHFGVDLPDAVGQAAKEIEDQMRRGGRAIDDALEKIPSEKRVRIVFDVDDPDAPRNSTPGERGDATSSGEFSFTGPSMRTAAASAASSTQTTIVVPIPMAVFTSEGRELRDVLPEIAQHIDRHLAEQGINGNLGGGVGTMGLHEVIDRVATKAATRVMLRAS